jgi:DNA-binding transcriptional LysR family regulator
MGVEANDLLLFSRVVEHGSFSMAAEKLGLPKSTVSRRIAHLEDTLGERLLQRTTRRLILTEFGTSLLDHARKVAEEVEAAGDLVLHRQAEPSGRLRISMPADFANLIMMPMMTAFMTRYPAITIELDLSPRRVDVMGENFDLAIRMGALPDDVNLVARKVMQTEFALFASPAYLAKHGAPAHPDELSQHATLCMRRQNGETLPWHLSRGKVQWERQMQARMVANSPDILVRCARDGFGIVATGRMQADEFVRNGELVEVLADWTMPVSIGWAVYPGRRLLPAKTRAFLDMMCQTFNSEKKP